MYLRKNRGDNETGGSLKCDKVDHLIRVGGLRGWSFGYEDGISLGMTKEVRESVSRDTETLEIEIFKGGDGTNFFRRMKNGRRLEAFEPRNPIDVFGDGPFLISEVMREKFQSDREGRRAIIDLTNAISENYGITVDRGVLKRAPCDSGSPKLIRSSRGSYRAQGGAATQAAKPETGASTPQVMTT
ncbi:DUF6461 domain-containing protein [Streptomyces sp. NPDC058008]|uniref:DUF6461 domain-containing protein n=1 Tax=Streptomyces sp. NPDC058008 TaxID=3346303 RepID=UPI0036E1536B